MLKILKKDLQNTILANVAIHLDVDHGKSFLPKHILPAVMQCNARNSLSLVKEENGLMKTLKSK
ncbi:MAG: hypothetical protein G01um101429_673 [Parcubacteria group bacterium Gr01-1014_29]|nr:MAG: hypothetical protein G01um101429_673 [Parcubacteria group bacterium Gr01-1014_29]